MKTFSLVAAVMAMTFAGVAHADMSSPVAPAPSVHVQVKNDQQSTDAPRHHWGGIDLSVGVPSGVHLGVVIRPYVNWLRVEVGAGHNLMAPGIFGNITLDPMPWAVGITLTGELGYYWSGPVPFVTNPPDVGYSYASVMPGLEFGPRNSVRFYFRGGFTWMHADVSNIDFGKSSNGVTLGNPKADLMAAPAVQMGLSIFF